MSNHLINKVASRVVLDIATSQWPESEWEHITKTFYVTIYDENGKPAEGVTTSTLLFLDSEGKPSTLVHAEHQNPKAPSNKNGVVELKYFLSCTPSSTPGVSVIIDVIAIVDEKMSNKVLLEFIEPTKFLAKPNIPAMLDGSIDDDDVENGVYAYALFSASSAAELYFCWGNAVQQFHIKEGTETFAVKIQEGILENGRHEISFYVVDGAKNAIFSNINVVNVERVNGGGAEGLNDLEAVVIVEAVETGYINKAISDRGVTLFITGWPKISMGEEDPIDATIDIDKTGLIVLQGFNKKNEKIGSPIYYPLKEGDFNNTTKTFSQIKKSVDYKFFNTIGEGSVEVKYSLNLVEDGKSHTSNLASRYLVDVIPPAKK
ncbi:hypothetical protein [Proteus hauseri]|uniref:hypothetical protein n=1 Tax=Proteus hauseri TaxID=183417 RepID=UPI0032DBAEB6